MKEPQVRSFTSSFGVWEWESRRGTFCCFRVAEWQFLDGQCCVRDAWGCVANLLDTYPIGLVCSSSVVVYHMYFLAIIPSLHFKQSLFGGGWTQHCPGCHWHSVIAKLPLTQCHCQVAIDTVTQLMKKIQSIEWATDNTQANTSGCHEKQQDCNKQNQFWPISLIICPCQIHPKAHPTSVTFDIMVHGGRFMDAIPCWKVEQMCWGHTAPSWNDGLGVSSVLR